MRELDLTLCHDDGNGYRTLQHVELTQLRILKLTNDRLHHEYLIKFLENNGKNLRELWISFIGSLLGLTVAKVCPKLITLYTRFKEAETLEAILNGCQHLESIKVWRQHLGLDEYKLLETIATYSPKRFYELRLCWQVLRTETFLKELESFFISWANRIPQKSFSLIIIDDSSQLRVKKESIEVIERFKRLGIIKRFEIVKHDFQI